MTNENKNPAPRQPNSRAEWDLEMEVFDMINNTPNPNRADVVNLIQKLWEEIVAREEWLKGDTQ